MITQEKKEKIMFDAGKAAALTLQKEAAGLSGTQIIDRENDAPDFDPAKDYSLWPVGSPVQDEGQVWTLITPHNAASYQGRPSTLRALWNLCHTTNPEKAKPWVDPLGQSGMYMMDECYIDEAGVVHRCIVEKTVYDANAMPSHWETVGEENPGDGGEEYPAWVAPTGAHDAYQKGAKVSHKGKKWISTADSNVWEPGEYGWEEIA